jgi:hypothetical protein
MRKSIIKFLILGLLAFVAGNRFSFAQENAAHSVLSQHTWYRLSVAEEGIYKLDCATLSAMGFDMESLNPNQIRIFGNVTGRLPEANSETRPDDLRELALYVSGAGDGSFDADDYVLFYGQEPTRWKLKENSGKVYERERNYYSDSTYYYLCVDSGVDGLRIGQKATLPVESATTVITEFPDFTWHEEELFSPYSIGQNWFGEMLNVQDTLLEIPFILPDLVKGKPIYIKTTLMGRQKKAELHYDLWVNDNILANHGSIAATNSDNQYGKCVTLDRQILSTSDTLLFSIRLYLGTKDPMLFLDYVEMFYWRLLKRSAEMYPFRLAPSQFGNGVSAIWVQNVDRDCQLWDVSAPLSPMVQEGILSGGNFVFATDERVERRFVMFVPSGIRPVTSWKAIPNQDLHSITGADMLILTAPMLWPQACELAQFHLEEDGLESVVVDVNEIYNEFSTGTPDPSGIRDFVRMVYRRSGGRLKYLTLFGRASFDFRNLKGFDRNFVPCYETLEKPEYMLSFCTDDFFGMMDEDEGLNSSGHVDLGIGRLPVSSVGEAEAALRKIRHYHDLSATCGEWKTNTILVAGDHETSEFVKTPEESARIFDTILHVMNLKKIYADAFPTVNLASGEAKPQAHDELISAIEKGALVMSYAGHGGVRGLTNKGLFTVTDIPNLNNFDKLPLVFTATCEFTKYDDPLLVSAGEQTFLHPQGGAVALLTSCRPTQNEGNKLFSKAFSNALFRRDEDGRPLRFGDIVRMSKNNDINYSQSNMVNKNIMYLLIGDPALRLSLPQEEVATLSVNGIGAHANEIEIHALSMVTVEGEVRGGTGNVDTDFNGKLWLRLFDKQSKIIMLNNPVSKYYHFKDVLYQGCVSVRNGRFTASFQVPSDINPGTDICRISYYAYDSIRGIDAQGAFDNITLGGTDPTMILDNEGPQISFYWNTTDFQNGDVTERQGTLYADLYDAQGIYHYDFSIGRDIVLNSNFSAFDNLILNERYEPALDDFRRGRIEIPVTDLTEGTYEFELKVWDMQNNPSTAYLWFVVGEDLFLAGVRNYPNPFSEETRITMTHVGEDGNFHVNMEVFDLMGRKVAVISENLISSGGGHLEPLLWDGRDNFGRQLPTGVYLYRLTLTDQQGKSRSVSQRMLISR